MIKLFGIAVACLLGLLVLWHIVFPLLGGIIPLAAGMWAVIIAAIAIFSMGILLLFIVTGIGILLLPVIAIISGVTAIVLFPFLFPILVPLLIIYLFIAVMRKKQEKSNKNS